MSAAIGGVLYGGAVLDTAEVQRADVGNVIRATAAGVGGKRDARRGGRRIEGEAEACGTGHIAGNIGLADFDAVRAFDGGETGAPALATIGGVLYCGAVLDAAEIERANVGDVIRGTAAGIGGKGHPRGGSRCIEREAETRGAGDVARNIGLAHFNAVGAFDGGETGAPTLPAISRIFDGGAGLHTGEVECADVGNVIRATAAGVGGKRDARRGGRCIEREAEACGVRDVAGHIGLADFDAVRAFDGGKAGAPALAAIGGVLYGGAILDTAEVQRADVGDVIRATVAGVGGKGHARRGSRGIEGEAEARGVGDVAG